MKHAFRILSVVMVLIMAAAIITPVCAQSGTATIKVTVENTSGQPISGARVVVTATLPGGSQTYVATTNYYGRATLTFNIDYDACGSIKVLAKKYHAAAEYDKFWEVDKTYSYTIKLSSNTTSSITNAGMRSSWYGANDPYDLNATLGYPPPVQWGKANKRMSSFFSGSQPVEILLVGKVDATLGTPSKNGAILWFDPPAWPPADSSVTFSTPDDVDLEAKLNYYDSQGIKVFLQVEPGWSPVENLIDLTMMKFSGHPSVIGFGVDVEWYNNSVDGEDGKKVDDAVASQWESRVKYYNPRYQLFLKHFAYSGSDYKLPDNYRGDIVFVDDSQGFSNKTEFVNEMAEFSKKFAPNDVMFQIGYDSRFDPINVPPDRKWWKNEAKPIPQTLGNALKNKVSSQANGQNVGIIWVDFTMRDPLIFGDPTSTGDSANAIFPKYDPPPYPTYSQWQPGTYYETGTVVGYDGNGYTCIQSHTSQVGWEPPFVPALWQPVPSGSTSWEPNVAYAVGVEVTYGGKTYTCLQAHTSLVGWEPPKVPALWKLK